MKDLNTKLKSCFFKRKYDSSGEAAAYMRKCNAIREVKLRVYHCDLCDGWHLTKKLKGVI